MNRTKRRNLGFLAAALIVTSTMAISMAQERDGGLPPETTAWEYPQARVASVPCIPLPAAVVLAGGPRGHRRAALPAAAVYVGPRALYPGTLAPWGSLPPAFYAASYPLPYFAPAVVIPAPHPMAHPVAPDALEPPVPAETHADGGRPGSALEPSGTAKPSLAPPETIPAPQPMDIPTDDEAVTPTPREKGRSTSPSGAPGSGKPNSKGPTNF